VKLNTFLIIFLLIFFSIYNVSGQQVTTIIENVQEAIENDEQEIEVNEQNIDRTVFIPNLSYTLVSFNDIKLHDARAGLTVARFNPLERDKLLSFSLFYRPTYVQDIDYDYPNLFHNAGVIFNYRTKRHTINAAFIGRTDKPVYGGLDTFIGLAGYSNGLINGEHFSLNLSVNLIIMDMGVKVGNDIPWILWPIPIITASWDYDLFSITLSPFPPLAQLVIAPKSPISFSARYRHPQYDFALWYRRFLNNNPSAELFGMGVGIKNEINRISSADDRRYGISYNAIYGSVRLFRLFEVSGGWAFNGKEGYGDNDLIVSDYNINIGQGFFVSISARIMF
jgi:hypothetical protein